MMDEPTATSKTAAEHQQAECMPPNSDEVAPCCVQLRCKSMYYRADERPGLLHWSNSMGYWCNASGDRLGPDGHVAMHPRCQSGRECFSPAPRV